ncbi:MAG: hypothetical protein H7A49_03510 [Akkermansiaceae bacterium]|nr:hypothetical protein [Akkermansiaceae bacterium]MCP5542957.1 hypothetical protein [Akkermansiaceae bacterium]
MIDLAGPYHGVRLKERGDEVAGIEFNERLIDPLRRILHHINRLPRMPGGDGIALRFGGVLNALAGLGGIPLALPCLAPLTVAQGIMAAFPTDSDEGEDFAAVFGVAGVGRASEFSVQEIDEEVIAPAVISGSGACGTAGGEFVSDMTAFFEQRDVDTEFGGEHEDELEI